MERSGGGGYLPCFYLGNFPLMRRVHLSICIIKRNIPPPRSLLHNPRTKGGSCSLSTPEPEVLTSEFDSKLVNMSPFYDPRRCGWKSWPSRCLCAALKWKTRIKNLIRPKNECMSGMELVALPRLSLASVVEWKPRFSFLQNVNCQPPCICLGLI